MADKDTGEHDVLKQSLPNASVLICLFHALRSFRRELTCEKLAITVGQKTLCFDLVRKMAYASSEAQHDLRDRFLQDAPKEVVHYFNNSWHPVRNEWVMGLKSSCGSYDWLLWSDTDSDSNRKGVVNSTKCEKGHSKGNLCPALFSSFQCCMQQHWRGDIENMG